jgi:A/G-specific adenine glycosylase
MNLNSDFTKALMFWYDYSEKRILPWKSNKDPYQIWLSEIILQQTRVEQGTPYFLRFIARYPSLTDLANAPDDEVMKLWQGLGYYARARNMLITARQIRDEFDGIFPDNFDSIYQLKGIGEYTAAAISSFAYDLPHAVLDGNVYRVLSRYFGIDTPIDSNEGKRIFKALSKEHLDTKRPADYNQAIMDFGATICKPQLPLCESCPLSDNCIAKENNKVSSLPQKSKKIKKRDRFFYYFVWRSPKAKTIVRKRDDKDIWKGLYDFPIFESNELLKESNLSKLWVSDTWKSLISSVNTDEVTVNFSRTYNQLLTHQKIIAIFVEISGKEPSLTKSDKEYKIISLPELKQLALPKTIQKYLETDLFPNG